MNITTRSGLLGFLLVLSALSIPSANATTNQSTEKASPSIEGRLNRITEAIRHRETQVQDTANLADGLLMAGGFANARGGGGFGNFNGGGAGWRDGGGFVNGGGGFVNGNGGGGFVNGGGGAGFRNW